MLVFLPLYLVGNSSRHLQISSGTESSSQKSPSSSGYAGTIIRRTGKSSEEQLMTSLFVFLSGSPSGPGPRYEGTRPFSSTFHSGKVSLFSVVLPIYPSPYFFQTVSSYSSFGYCRFSAHSAQINGLAYI